jgi:hypothetical protein
MEISLYRSFYSLREEWLSAASTRARGGGNSNAAQSDVSLTVGASPSVVLGSMTKGPRLNRAVVASVLEEDYGAAQQIEEMKKALARIQQEKEAAEGRAKVEIESHQRTVQSEMQKQQEELREMMESMKREKEEIRLRAALLDAEKAAMKEEAERKALTEMNRFNEALDVMKSQNLMLINRMELSQQETKTLLERERSERMVMQLEMEKENKRLTSQLIEAQIQVFV